MPADPGPLVARVVPDLTGLDRQFDYLVPEDMRAQVHIGSLVRISQTAAQALTPGPLSALILKPAGDKVRLVRPRRIQTHCHRHEQMSACGDRAGA